METSRCSACQQIKPVTEFAKRSDRPRGVASRCKACQRSARCADCGTSVTRYATFCMACRSKGDRNPIAGTSRPAHVREAVSRAQRGAPEPARPPQRPSTASSGRSQANRLYAKPSHCERCGEPKSLDWHHVNSDPTDNRRENLRGLCRRCHQIEDGRHVYVTEEMPSIGRRSQLGHAAPRSDPQRSQTGPAY